MLHQANVDEIIPENPTMVVNRLAQSLTDVDLFTEERETVLEGPDAGAQRRKIMTGKSIGKPADW